MDGCARAWGRSPPAGHPAHELPEDVRRFYFSAFDPLRTEYRERADLWARYGDQADVAAWGTFFRTCLPDLWERFDGIDRP